VSEGDQNNLPSVCPKNKLPHSSFVKKLLAISVKKVYKLKNLEANKIVNNVFIKQKICTLVYTQLEDKSAIGFAKTLISSVSGHF